MPKLVRIKGSDNISIQFQCYECRKMYITSFDNFSKSYICSGCKKALVNTLPVFCHYEDEDCGGRYEACGGSIYKLSNEEYRNEERKAFEPELDISVGARPTDSFHDDIGDIRSDITIYKCSRCGDPYNARQANGKGFDSGMVRCQRIICSSCRRFPKSDELPEPDANVDDTPLKRFFFN